MLAHLSIRDIVLIEKLDIDFARGLSVLTGETGAGKSFCSMRCPLRLARAAMRDWCGTGRRRDISPPCLTLLPIIRRALCCLKTPSKMMATSSCAGCRRRRQARVFVNDQPASVTLLQELGAALVEIHGQHDDRAMVAPEAHRALA